MDLKGEDSHESRWWLAPLSAAASDEPALEMVSVLPLDETSQKKRRRI